jgi:LysB family phage lysis regulatory protein
LSRLASSLIAAVVVLAAAISGASYVRSLRADFALAQQQRDDAQRSLVDRDNAIRQLRKDAADKEQQQAQLNRTHTAIARRLHSVQTTNRRLINENAALLAWAGSPLPDDVVRMQTSPALTGADDYLKYVSTGERVHAASDVSVDQR